MAMTDDKAVFIDTNVLVYASIPESPLHPVALGAIQTLEQADRELWISRQVLREYLATLTRPQIFIEPISVAMLAVAIRQFENRFQVAEDNQQVTQRLLELIERIAVGGRQIHDANIVATMQIYGVHQLLTHNTTDFERFAEFITVLPLVENEG
ncbi:MAG TPA: VapC toxin family PIN domain ribonuclease [Cyanobacteria bacterium UBA8553]|nr:VapC toxin family PIN domain ribonuclease [Cyanobacteria bacterium UBA8553]HAJ62628.1 VapC toxin family PIN domain ribonuclease [Cyanobacteria bacterium UBA8543]